MKSVIMRIWDKISKPSVAYAHCDVPCGIYEVDTMLHAADTVQKMVEKLQELKHPKEGDNQSRLNFVNTAARMVATKEEHAQKCKEQILILWTDYFKPEHLEKFPDLHEKIWKATKLCSDAKRNVDIEVAKKLKNSVAEIAEMFAESKK
jgi:nickel superoxide dismutase